jgi:hypothetical protein
MDREDEWLTDFGKSGQDVAQVFRNIRVVWPVRSC